MQFDWIKSAPTRVSEMWSSFGRVRDLLADPVTSAADSVKSIIQRLSGPMQRLIALILLVLALLFGVDIGISYQKALSGPLAATVQTVEEVPPVTPSSKRASPHPSERRGRETRTLRTVQPTAPPRRVMRSRVPVSTIKPARRDEKRDDPYRVYQPGTLTSSGINGY